MNFWKLSALFAFGAVTTLCVNYAHSQTQRETLVWKSAWILGSCSLKATPIDGNLWAYQAGGHSRTQFTANWPKKAGELWMMKGYKPGPNDPIVGGEPVEPDETMLIKFQQIDGKIEPVSYVFDNVKLRKETKGVIQPQTCTLGTR